MPRFAKADFTKDNATRLSVIIMSQLGKPPLTGFASLPESQKGKFNRMLNEYIQSLGETWEDNLLGDFNRIVQEDVINEDFRPENTFIRDLSTTRELVLSDEQKAYFDTEPSEFAKIKV